MNFAQPGFLWALTALAIPVLIHLFNFQKTEKIIFANTRILNEVIQQTQKSRQLKNWLLLMVRMLAFTFLIFAFAQPQFQSQEAKNASKSLTQSVVYVDNSVSMFAAKDGKSAFDIAIATAKTIPNRFSQKGWFQLLTNSFETKHTWTSPSGFQDQLTDASNPSQTRNFQTILNRIERQQKSQNLGEQKPGFIISDFQKSNIGPLEKLRFDSTKTTNLVIVKHEDQSNIWVDSVWLPRPISLRLESQEVKVKLLRTGLPLKRKVNIQLYADGNLISGKIVDPGEQNAIEVSLPFRIKARELKQCTLTTDDPEITFDNSFYFKLQAPPPSFVYLISEIKNQFLSTAFSNKDLFQKLENTYSTIDYKKLKESDLIILNEPKVFDDALLEACIQKVEEGKSVLIFAGKESGELQKKLSLQRFELNSNNIIQKPQDWLVKLPEKSNLFFAAAFREISQSTLKPFSNPYIFLKSGSTLLSYENGNPYLSQASWGNGNLFFVSGPLNDGESSVQKHPLIIPMLYNIVSKSQIGSENTMFGRISQSSLSVVPDSIFQWGEKGLNLEKGEIKIKTSARKKGSSILVDLPIESLSPGFWNIVSETQKLGVLALNQDKQESEIEYYSEDEMKAAFSKMPWISISSIEENESVSHAKIGETESIALWKYFILAGLLMFALEMLIAKKGNSTTKSI
jgi:hypothetical protein